MTLRFTKAVQLLHRPHLITAEAATQYLPRLLGFDPRVVKHTQPLELVARLARRPMLMDDNDRSPAPPTKPAAYAPRYVGEPDAVSDAGWTLKSGVGLMSIDTPLVDKGFGVCEVWFHGYDTIEAAIREMDADDRVRGIFIKWDCPGGVVAPGLYDLTAYLQGRKTDARAKPLWSYADMACSGAYWLGSQSDRLICHEAALVGSIGAVFTHVSLAGMYEAQGVTITPVQFGAHKTDGADYKPLDDAARAGMQAEIDQIGEDFLAVVAAGRGGRLTAEQARATEARVYSGRSADRSRDALALGLVDAVMPEHEAFAAFVATLQPPARAPAPPPPITTETHMTRAARLAAIATIQKSETKTSDEKLDEIRSILAEAEEDVAEAETDEDKPDAESEDDKPDAEDDDEKPSAAAALMRAQAILDLPEARGREPLARELAFDPAFAAVTVAKAKATLGKAPLVSRMAGNVIDPKISRDGGPALTPDQQLEDAGFAAAGIRPLPRR